MQRRRCLHVPIHPASHPDLDIRLHLAKGCHLPKNSYVKIEALVTLPSSFLRSLYEGPCRLKESSLKKLQEHVHLPIPDGFLIRPDAVAFHGLPDVRDNEEEVQPLFAGLRQQNTGNFTRSQAHNAQSSTLNPTGQADSWPTRYAGMIFEFVKRVFL